MRDLYFILPGRTTDRGDHGCGRSPGGGNAAQAVP